MSDDDPRQVRPSPRVEVRAPDRRCYRFSLHDDDTAVVLVDGQPTIGIDVHGPGHWPDGHTWERLPTGGAIVAQHVTVFDMTQHQHAGLTSLLGRPQAWFGRWRGGPHDVRTITIDAGEYSCGGIAALNMAIGYVREQNLRYEHTRTTRYQPSI